MYEVDSLGDQEREGQEKRKALAARLSELEAGNAAAGEVAALTAGMEDLRQQRDAANAALTESKVALASEEQLASSFRQQRGALEQRIRELGQTGGGAPPRMRARLSPARSRPSRKSRIPRAASKA